MGSSERYIVIASIIFHRIEMENQNIGDKIRSEIMTDLRTSFPVTTKKLFDMYHKRGNFELFLCSTRFS